MLSGKVHPKMVTSGSGLAGCPLPSTSLSPLLLFFPFLGLEQEEGVWNRQENVEEKSGGLEQAYHPVSVSHT